MKTLLDESIRRSLLDRLAKLQPASQAQWGRMTAPQMICHLSDSYRRSMTGTHVNLLPTAIPRRLLKKIALYSPLEWPKGKVKAPPEVAQGEGGTPPGDFEQDRATLADLIEKFGQPGPDFPPHDHPIFGAMRTSEWMRWGYLHADHHFRQFGV